MILVRNRQRVPLIGDIWSTSEAKLRVLAFNELAAAATATGLDPKCPRRGRQFPDSEVFDLFNTWF